MNYDLRNIDLTDAAKAGSASALVTLGILAPAAFVVWVAHRLTGGS